MLFLFAMHWGPAGHNPLENWQQGCLELVSFFSSLMYHWDNTTNLREAWVLF